MSRVLVPIMFSILFSNISYGAGRVRVGLGCGYNYRARAVYSVPYAGYAAPFAWQYSVGATKLGEERIRLLEDVVIRQQKVTEELTRIVSGGAAGGGVSQSEVNARRVFNTSCAKCHTGPGAKGNMDLTQLSFNVFDKALISQMVGSGQMPPPDSGVKLTQQDVDAVQQWAGESADEFRQELRKLRAGGNGNGRTAPTPMPMPK